MNRSAFFLLTTIGLHACGTDKTPVETNVPVEAPISGEPYVPSNEPRENSAEAAAKEAARREAAVARLDALRASSEKGTPEALWEGAESAYKKQNWKEARDYYRAFVLQHTFEPRAAAAVQRGTLCSFALGEYGEGLTWHEDSLELYRGKIEEARLLRVLGNLLLAVPKWGVKKGGEILRGRSDQGIWVDTHRHDRALAIKHLEKSRELMAGHVAASGGDTAKLVEEQIDGQLDLVAALSRFSPFDGTWGYWYYAWEEAIDDERVDEEGADEQAGRWGRGSFLWRAKPRGVPVDESGNVIFDQTPEQYSATLSTTSKIKYLLEEIRRIDPTEKKERAAEATYRQAQLFLARDGQQRLTRLEHYWWMGVNPYQKDIQAAKPWTLADDEVLGLIATHIGVYEVPDDECVPKLLQQIYSKYPQSSWADKAQVGVAAFHQSRQQYRKALDVYRKYLAEKPKGSEAELAKGQINLIERPELKIGRITAQVAGENASLPVEYRNLEKVSVRAARIDMAKLIEDFKRSWKSGREGAFSYGSATENPTSYLLHEDKGENYLKYVTGGWKTFSLSLKDDGEHRPITAEPKIPISEPGLWFVEVGGGEGKSHFSRGFVLIEAIAVVVKATGKGDVAWIVDARSGQPIQKAVVETFEYWSEWPSGATKAVLRHREGKFAADDRGLADLDRRTGYGQRVITVRRNGELAWAGGWYSWGYSPSYDYAGLRAVMFSDRPVYRPLDTVKMQIWARQRREGKYLPASSVKTLRIEVHDPKGAKIFEKDAAASNGGALFELPLPKSASLGMYQVHIKADGSYTDANAQFRVEEYKAPELEVKVSAGDGPAKLGEKIAVKISAEYYFGGPVEAANVHYKVYRSDHQVEYSAPGTWDWLYGAGYGRVYYAYPWFGWWEHYGPRPWRWYPWWGPPPEEKKELVTEGEGLLDHHGALSFEIDTSGAKQKFGDKDQRFTVEAEVRDASRRTITGNGEVIATRSQFFVHLETDRGYYETGSTIRTDIRSLLPTGDPIATNGELRIALVSMSASDGRTIEESPVHTAALRTDGEGRAETRWDVKTPGQYRISYVAKDAWGGEVVGSTLVWVWGPGFDGQKYKFNHLEVISDKRTYKVGEIARLLISSDVAGAHVLFGSKVDQGHLIEYDVLVLDGKTKIVEVPIKAEHVPNFFVEATVVGAGKLSEEAREMYVPPPQAEVKVSLLPKKSEFRAAGAGELEIQTYTPDGKPVSTEVAVSVFDRAVLYIQPELTPDVRKLFWGSLRSHQPLSGSNLRRVLDNWQQLFQPDDSAAQILTPGNDFLQRTIDFTRADLATIEGNVSGGIVADGSFGAAGLGAGGGGRGKSAARAPAGSAAPAAPPAEPARAEAKRESAGKRDADSSERQQAADPGASQGLVAPMVRRNFADTAFFTVVRTNEQGKATIDWKFPDNLTTWRVKGVALGEDTRAGEATASVVTTQKLLVRLQAPRFFRERDRVMISANVHNRLGSEKKVKVSIDIGNSPLDLEGDASKWVTVGDGKEARVDWWVKVRGEGQAIVKVAGESDQESDAKELRFPVLVHGMLKTVSSVGSIAAAQQGPTAEKALEILVPEERRADQSELIVRWAPTLSGAMIDALPYLLEYPYGCTEQTLSRFVPAVLTRRSLQMFGGVKLEDLGKIKDSLNPQRLSGESDKAYKMRLDRELRRFDRNPVYNTALMNDMIGSGLARLLRMQKPDGGWGWWSDDRSSIYTTAHVLAGLYEAQQADVAVPADVLARARSALHSMVPDHLSYYRDNEWVSDTDAYFAYTLSLFGDKNDQLNKYLLERRAKLSVYGKSLFAMALKNLGKHEDASLVFRNAAQLLKEDPENETAWVETRSQGWWWWWNDPIESNATFLRAMITLNPEDARAPRLVKWLLNHRKNGWYWSSTRDTAVTIAAFAHYMRAAKEQDTNYDLEVLLDGKVLKTVHIDKKNLLSFDGELRLKGDEVPGGKHTLTFRRKGKGAVYFNAYLTYFTLEEDVAATGLEIKVDRKYYRLVRDDRTHEVHDQKGRTTAIKEAAYRKVALATGDEVKIGDLILVELNLESKNDYEFLAFEDPKPAGFEPVALRSGTTYGEAVANLELRDEKVVFFLGAMNQGKLRLDYRLRAEIPGTFHAMPAHGFGMYAPELVANSHEMRISVDD